MSGSPVATGSCLSGCALLHPFISYYNWSLLPSPSGQPLPFSPALLCGCQDLGWFLLAWRVDDCSKGTLRRRCCRGKLIDQLTGLWTSAASRCTLALVPSLLSPPFPFFQNKQTFAREINISFKIEEVFMGPINFFKTMHFYCSIFLFKPIPFDNQILMNRAEL